MKLEVLGSGGAVATPQPLCACSACVKARKKGGRHARLGPSVFLHGPDILIDTPEEISVELNRSRVRNIGAVLYSHWHPDHTAGRRLFEMNIEWNRSQKENRTTPVILTEKIAETFGSYLSIMSQFDYFRSIGIVDLRIVKNDEEFTLNGCTIKPVQMAYDYSFGYCIAEGGSRCLVIMDELKNWEPDAAILSTRFDAVYLPLGVLDANPITGEQLIEAGHPILEDEQTANETLAIVRKLNAGRFVLSHIEEPDCIGYAFARKLSRLYSKRTGKRIDLAFDGMLV